MAVYVLAIEGANCIAPIIGGFIAAGQDWKWVIVSYPVQIFCIFKTDRHQVLVCNLRRSTICFLLLFLRGDKFRSVQTHQP